MSQDLMNQDLWTAVDHYIIENLVPQDDALDEATKANTAANLPAIDVTPNQGKFLHLLARIRGAQRILEIGTLGGYSTIWLARALPSNGRLMTLEVNPEHAKVALANIRRAGLSEKVELRLGPALDSLAQLEKEKVAPFDFVFLDADKRNNPVYLKRVLQFSRPGTVIVVDNVVRDGEVIDRASQDPDVQGSRGVFEWLAAEPKLDATALQTVSSKGHDGFVLALVR
jgi:predicted O-methyltransferase YrrM